MNLSLELKRNNDPTITCLVCGQTDCGLYFILRDRRDGRTHALGIHRDCAETNMESQAKDAARQMHPNGECTCGGEGRCLWCERSNLSKDPPNKYLAGLADAACQIHQDIRRQLIGTPWYDEADNAWKESNRLLRTVSFIGEGTRQ